MTKLKLILILTALMTRQSIQLIGLIIANFIPLFLTVTISNTDYYQTALSSLIIYLVFWYLPLGYIRQYIDYKTKEKKYNAFRNSN